MLNFEETPVVRKVEERLAKSAGLELKHLGMLRLVRVGTQHGLCNRGLGPKSAFVCLSDTDDLFFMKLGMRLVLQKGDAILLPNVDWETGRAAEDLRTSRVHLECKG